MPLRDMGDMMDREYAFPLAINNFFQDANAGLLYFPYPSECKWEMEMAHWKYLWRMPCS